MTILVTGATGTVGRQVVAQLHAAGHPVRALSRRPARTRLDVEVAFGDLGRPDSLAPALEGVTAAHLITFDGESPLETGTELVSLLERAGVRQVSVLSGWEESGVERALRDSPIGWTWLRPVEFMANAVVDWAPFIRAGHPVPVFGDQPGAVVHEADIAAVAVASLTEDGHAGQEYQLTGPETLSQEDRLVILGKALGRDVPVRRETEAEYRARLLDQGFAADYLDWAVQLSTSPPAVGGVPQPTVREVTGRPGRTFEQWARENAHQFQPTGG
ncbi:uncharacterized protein YbjT (DUF2867 family) [Crossiella equi]|uniref:Uncharacterized protein YbjT (DUF2867 family) n=1 Tax=Crossiella equi TaxID=130796 RepID=A0ABS5A9K3_9PSEU|nr:NAD(P)H-binding protein [Crossiella equi]MBP2472420.1 uncharacterized protein YbjT (DUF2867 family) [Crossiella equi]